MIKAGVRQLDSVSSRIIAEQKTVHAVALSLDIQRQRQHLALHVTHHVEVYFLLPLRSKTHDNRNAASTTTL